eukprot:765654-Hanusia_phi.AAC.1
MMNNVCYECPINTYSDGISCIPCTQHSSSPSSSINCCECMAGYYYFATNTCLFQCVTCPVSTYKDNVGKYTKVNNARLESLLTADNLIACAYTALEQSPWFRIDLGRPLDIGYVSIYANDQSNIQPRVGNSTDISRTLVCQNRIEFPAMEIDCHFTGQHLSVYYEMLLIPQLTQLLYISTSQTANERYAFFFFGSTSQPQCSCDLVSTLQQHHPAIIDTPR